MADKPINASCLVNGIRRCSELVDAVGARIRRHCAVTDFHVSCWKPPADRLVALIDVEGQVDLAAAEIGASMLAGNTLYLDLVKPDGFVCDCAVVGATCLGMCE